MFLIIQIVIAILIANFITFICRKIITPNLNSPYYKQKAQEERKKEIKSLNDTEDRWADGDAPKL